jgi:carbon monoxide dehydrogenase subunit G
MATFSARNQSRAVVPADRSAIWDALTDPILLTKLTPLLSGIDADGDRWRWQLGRISALGVTVSPVFTEQMRFEPKSLIEFSHQAPPKSREYAGASGSYRLTEVAGGTELAIDLTLTVELPLPRLAAGAVERVIAATMARTGDRFSKNLLRHLGV